MSADELRAVAERGLACTPKFPVEEKSITIDPVQIAVDVFNFAVSTAMGTLANALSVSDNIKNSIITVSQQVDDSINSFVENTPVLKQLKEIDDRNVRYAEEHNITPLVFPITVTLAGPFNANQQALVSLAKEAKQVRGGLTMKEYETLKAWAEEYKLKARFDPFGKIGGWAKNNPHFHIGPVRHIPLKK